MKKVLVTGGATGIGKACALLFEKEGYDVYITYNRTEPDYDVKKIKCDLKNTDEIKTLFDTEHGFDILVNNAGVSLIKMINDVTDSDYEAVTAVNERAVYFMCKYALKDMINKKSWEEFRDSGMLWWINMILHTFGWAITVEIEDDKLIKELIPLFFNNVKEVSSFHRIQATPGYRQAANYVCDKLIKEGIDAKVLSYEANDDQFYLNAKMFKEWDYKEVDFGKAIVTSNV